MIKIKFKYLPESIAFVIIGQLIHYNAPLQNHATFMNVLSNYYFLNQTNGCVISPFQFEYMYILLGVEFQDHQCRTHVN